MSKYQGRALAIALLLGGSVGSASADTLNIPVSAGMTDPATECTVLGALGLSSFAPNVCMVQVPIVVPAGHTIKQINIAHGTHSNFANPYIEASLWSVDFMTSQSAEQFPWSSSAYVPDGTWKRTHLMSQINNTFPDAFVAGATKIYQLRFTLLNGVILNSVQVIYD